MSKTQLQTNNARLASLITELEGKAAGGGGSGGSYEGEFASITDNGMFEPGMNEYVFDYSNHDIDLSAATVLFMFLYENVGYYGSVMYKSLNGYNFMRNGSTAFDTTSLMFNQTAKTFTVLGTVDSFDIVCLGFKAYFD